MKQLFLLCAIGVVGLVIVHVGLCLVLIHREVATYRRGFDGLRWTRLTYENRVDGTGPLHALAIWPRDKEPLPLLVVMHGFADASDEYFSEGRFWAERGRFCLLPDMRGRASRLRYPLDLVAGHDPLGWHIPGWYRMVQWFGRPLAEDQFQSSGRPDANGAELLDIESAVTAMRRQYGSLILPGTDIVGYSGGGSNVLLAVAKMPYFFERGAAFFPIIDFAQQDAYYTRSRDSEHSLMRSWIGGSPEQLPHHYATRSALTLLENLRYTSLWLFADRSDRLCPAEFAEDFAHAAQTHANISVHISGPGDRVRWLHDTPNEHSPLHHAEATIFASTRSTVHREAEGVELWLIAGYLLLPDVEIYLEDLQQGVVRCTLTRRAHDIELTFTPVSAQDGLRATVRIRRASGWVEHREVPMNQRTVFERD